MTEVFDIEARTFGTRCCGNETRSQITAEAAQRLSDELQMLAHPVRMQILDVLARHAGQVCVCDLEAALPVKQPTVSHHLRLLRSAGLIDCERHGQWAYYFLKREALAALRTRATDWMATLG